MYSATQPIIMANMKPFWMYDQPSPSDDALAAAAAAAAAIEASTGTLPPAASCAGTAGVVSSTGSPSVKPAAQSAVP